MKKEYLVIKSQLACTPRGDAYSGGVENINFFKLALKANSETGY